MPPSITGITPTSGPTGGGTSFEITGSGLAGIVSVTFGDIEYEATELVATDTSVTGLTPAHPAGTVSVAALDGEASHLVPDEFTFTDAGSDEGGSEVATVYSVNRTLSRAGTAVDARKVRGPVKYAFDTYEAAALASTSIIEFDILLKAGEIPISFLVITDALGSAVTMDLGLHDVDGNALDIDCFMDGVDVSSAVTVAGGGGDTPDAVTIAGTVTSGVGIGMPLAEDARVTATINAASATGTIYVGVLYAANP